MSVWQFHFRNADANPQASESIDNWFGVYHFGCGGAIHDGRSNCWGATIPPNLLGGDNSVYNPAASVVDADEILNEVLAGFAAAANFGVFIASGGSDVAALAEGVVASLGLTAQTVQAALDAQNINPAQLQAYLNDNLATAAASVNMTVEEVTGYANAMGLQPGTWGFIGGQDYVSRVHDDNDENEDAGWTVLRADPTSSPNYIANGAWTQYGHLIYLWDRWLLPGPTNNWGGKSSLWLPF